MAKRPTMATDPLAAVIPGTVRSEEPAEYGTAHPKKERTTMQLRAEILDKVRDIVYWTPGETMAGFAEDALVREIKRREKERGEPFPARKGKVRTGRPMRG